LSSYTYPSKKWNFGLLPKNDEGDQMHGGWLHNLQKMVVAKMLTTMVEIPKSVEMASKKKEKKKMG